MFVDKKNTLQYFLSDWNIGISLVAASATWKATVNTKE